MNTYTKIARASAVCAAAALLGAGAASAQPADGSSDGVQWMRALSTRSETLHTQHTEADPFTACRTVGTPLGLERFLCYRAAANLANEQYVVPRPLTRPIVVEGSGFGWSDAAVGFTAAAGLMLLGAGTAAAVRSRG